MLEAFVARFGYLAIGLGTFLEGETVLLAGGAFAHKGLLSLPGVIVAAFVGSLAGDQLWFFAGRHFGRRVIERRPRWKAQVARIDGFVARFGTAFVLGFRFLYGLRSVTPLFLGASGYPALRFALFNVIGAAVWAVGFGVGGWALGATLATVLRRSVHVEEALLGAVVLVAAGWAGSRALRRRR